MRASAYLRLVAASLLLAAGTISFWAQWCAVASRDAADPFEAKIYRGLAAGQFGYSLEPITALLNDVLRDALEGVFVTDSSNVSAILILPDGAVLPPADRRLVHTEEARDAADRRLASHSDLRRYGTFARIDSGLFRQLENCLKFLQRGGSRVFLFLPPYHPAIYREILRHPDNHLAAIEIRIRLLDHKLAIPLIGSYNPDRAGVGPGDFQDGDHLLEAGLRRLCAPAIPALGGPATPSSPWPLALPPPCPPPCCST